MSTPTIEAPAPIAAPKRPWYVKKRFTWPVVAAIFFIAGASTGGGSSSAPAACGTALDLSSQFVTAVDVEHKAIGVASVQAQSDGDVATMLTGVASAINGMTATATALTPDLGAAATTCRGAIK